MALAPPTLLSTAHELAHFDCGEPSLDEWLKRRALANIVTGATRTYVVCDDAKVVGYYALSSGDVAAAVVPGKVRHNMPDPIPVVLLARLAIDRHWQGKGLGRSLFRDAVLRVLQAAELIGIRTIVVQEISDEASEFYRALGFEDCPGVARMMVVTLGDARAVVGVSR